MGFKTKHITKELPLPSNWSAVKVSDIADINKRTLKEKTYDGWIEYIDITAVDEHKLVGTQLMDFNFAPSRARRVVTDNDILISTVRPNLKHYVFIKQAKPNYIASTGFAVVSPQNNVEPRYLYYYLTSNPFTDYLSRVADGGAYPAFNPSEISNAEIPLPPLPEQKAIASILGALDDKIELNRKMNETLEVMARAIFKSWFVDFDPIYHKMGIRRGDPMWSPNNRADTQVCPYMTPEILSLFPDSLEDSPLGKIPKGWRVGTIGDVIELAYGKALKEELRQPGKIPVYGSNGQVGWHNEKLVEGPGIVVGRKGNPGIVTWAQTNFYPIDTTFYVVPKGIIKSMYYLFRALKLQDLVSLGADSAVPGLNRNMAYMSKLIVPPEQIISAFDKQVKSLADTVHHNNEQSHTLASIRDALLPKLLSGEIRVKDAERFVEANV